MKSRQPRSDRKRYRHDAPCREARDIDDLRSLEDRRRARFVKFLAELPHQRRSLFDPVLCREIGEAELEDSATTAKSRARFARHSRVRSACAECAARWRGKIRSLSPPPTSVIAGRCLSNEPSNAKAFGERRHEFLVLLFFV